MLSFPLPLLKFWRNQLKIKNSHRFSSNTWGITILHCIFNASIIIGNQSWTHGRIVSLLKEKKNILIGFLIKLIINRWLNKNEPCGWIKISNNEKQTNYRAKLSPPGTKTYSQHQISKKLIIFFLYNMLKNKNFNT